MMNTPAIYHHLWRLLADCGVPATSIDATTTVLLSLGLVIVAALVYFILKRYVTPLLVRVAQKTETTWDDILLNPLLLVRLWRLIALFIISFGLPYMLGHYPHVAEWAKLVINVSLIVVSAMLAMAFIRTIFEIVAEHSAAERENEDNDYNPALLEERARTESHSLGGVSQMLQMVVIVVALILIFSLLSGKNVLIILSGLGASAAVLMLVFKDSILGMVAGIQLTANDMLRPGDWIAMPKYDINGRVRRINLTTVKIQNYDNTIITIPPYLLVSETFQNWRGMERSGGRRMMRSLNIDLHTIRFCTAAEIEQWRDEPWWPRVNNPANPVNVSVLRAYLEYYITIIPTLVPDMLYMIREHQPGPYGLPVEIYFFTSKTSWAEYESVQADVLDHAIAMVPRFGLKVYQLGIDPANLPA